jgi:DNA invertase Pin-like site-specific DNA recombinase
MMVQCSANRAVMYVRMSTERQDYSTDHQRAKIREYASARDIAIIREYVDDGKSGLDIKRRAGLQALMRDVQAPRPDFNLIIVYDISRWGRFQDVDEAAYHEHTCRRAGIKVEYCSEIFVNESGPFAALLKNMKRVMAAEYSRELSEKVYVAQSRFIQMGFKQGGSAGFGLRRLALKADGTPRAILEPGEQKVSATDRVILVWGPDEEVAVVRRVYELYLDQGFSQARIARVLNSEHISNEHNRPWTQNMVNCLLTNVKYCGALAYARYTAKLSGPRIRNPPDKWIMNPAAVDPIISAERFEAAQVEHARRMRRYTASELIALVQACYERHGKVNAQIIAKDPVMPDPQVLVRAFGSLVRAYDAAGLPQSDKKYVFVDTKRKLLPMRQSLFLQVEALAQAAGATTERVLQPFTLVLNGTVRVRVEAAPIRRPTGASPDWRVIQKRGVDFIIAGRIDGETRAFLDYFLVPVGDMPSDVIYLRESKLERYKSWRFTSLNEMFGMAVVDHQETPC